MKRIDYFQKNDASSSSPLRAFGRSNRESEKDFSNAYGDEEGYEGDEHFEDESYEGDNYGGGEESNFGMARANAAVGQIDTTNNVISITVTNTDPQDDEPVTLFGAYAAEGLPNFGNKPVTVDVALPANNSGILIESQTLPYGALLGRLKATPMSIRGARFVFNGTKANEQQQEKIILEHIDTLGDVMQKPYLPANYKRPEQNVANMIDHVDFQLMLTGEAAIKFKLKAGTSVTLTFFINGMTDLSRMLRGGSPLEVTNTRPAIAFYPQPQTVIQKRERRPWRRRFY